MKEKCRTKQKNFLPYKASRTINNTSFFFFFFPSFFSVSHWTNERRRPPFFLWTCRIETKQNRKRKKLLNSLGKNSLSRVQTSRYRPTTHHDSFFLGGLWEGNYHLAHTQIRRLGWKVYFSKRNPKLSRKNPREKEGKTCTSLDSRPLR